jgi:Protein of unknown function (DUF3592)
VNEEEVLLEQYRNAQNASANRKRITGSTVYAILLIMFVVVINVIHLSFDRSTLLFGTFLLFVSLYSFILQFRTSLWVETECKVLKKDIAAQSPKSFFPVVYYLYTAANGHKYICDKFDYNPWGSSKVWKAEDTMGTYEEGKSYRCYYDSRRPERAVLTNKTNFYSLVLGCVGIAIILLPFIL